MERVLACAVLGLAAARLLGVAAMPAVRREVREHPVLGLAGVGAGLVVLAIVASAARAATPWPLRILAGGTIAGWTALALRARPSFGRRHGLPPGSLGLGASLRAIVDPTFYAQAAAQHGPIFKMAQFHRPVACVVGIAEGRALLRRCGDALRPPALPLSAEVPRGFLRYMAPADHARYSRLFRAAVSEASLRAVEPFAVTTTASALAALAQESRRATTNGVRPQTAIEHYLRTILLRLYFGDLLQPGDDAVIADCGRDADLASATGRAAPCAVQALRRFEDLLTTRAATHDPGDAASIWGGILRLEPDAGRDRTVLGNLFLLLEASQHSIGGMLCWMLVLMSSAPEWRALVRTRPPVADDDPYARAVLETLRLAQSEYVYREVLQPITIGDFVINPSWLLRICVAESHRRAAIFPDPDRFDPERHLARRYGPEELSPFGLDLHACLGARMTVLLGRIFAHALVHDVDWEVLADGPKERGNRHWRHWEPSPHFRITLRPRA